MNNEREQILEAIKICKIEQRAIKIITDMEMRLHRAVGMAIEYHLAQLGICDLITYCTTGKYPV